MLLGLGKFLATTPASAAPSCGIPPDARSRTLWRSHSSAVFVVSALFAAIPGSLFAHYSAFITPGEATFLRSIEFITMVVLGGMASTFGAVIGAAILTVLPQALTVFHDYEHVLLGLILIVVMVFLPKGLVPSVAAIASRRRR